METLQSHPNPDVSSEPQLLDDPDSDIIVRSYDLQEFRVLKFYLIKNSTVLSELIQSSTVKSPDSSTSLPAGSLSCIRLSDSGTILSSLLSFVLPVPSILPPSSEQIMELLSVAQKYMMNSTLAHIRGAIASQDPPFIRPETAFHIYSLAQRYGLGPEVFRAARMALTFPMTIQGLESKFDTMPGTHLRVLWKYYQRVRINLRSDLQVFRTHGVRSTLAGLTCQTANSSGIPTWIDTYIASIGEDPALFSLTEFHMCFTRHLLTPGCTLCKNMTAETIHAFWKALTTVVNKSMADGEQDLLLTEEEEKSLNLKGSASPGPRNGYLDPPHADVMIQSSDLVNFRVNKVVLSVSSPFFADMFSLPQPPDNDVVDGLPVVRLSEDAELLSRLLTMLYPVPSVVPDSYDKAVELLAVCQKYDMAGIQSSIRTEIKSWGPVVLTGMVAHRAYAISSNAKLLPEMEAFARHTLDFPMTLEYLSDELPLFAGWALRDLARYRKRCRDRLVSTLQSFLDSAALSGTWVVCGGVAQGTVLPPGWLRELFSRHIKNLQETFTDPLLKPSSIRGEYISALNTHVNTQNCQNCPRQHILKGETLCVELESKLTQALNEVRRTPDSLRT
ncbi:hypothetical protein EDB85DRAFT_2120444 [Lactarius pseudohatsudake]|nr:hypothetical protein EDB85DRAFT_2120444 [Lactarius pseudohatsudake]